MHIMSPTYTGERENIGPWMMAPHLLRTPTADSDVATSAGAPARGAPQGDVDKYRAIVSAAKSWAISLGC